MQGDAMTAEPISYYYKPGGRLHRAGRGEISAQISEDCSVALEILAKKVGMIGPPSERFSAGGGYRLLPEEFGEEQTDAPDYMMDMEEIGREERLTLEYSLPRAARRVVKYCLPRGVGD